MNRWLAKGLILLTGVVVAAVIGVYAMSRMMEAPLQITQAQELLLVEPGTTLSGLIDDLDERNILPHPIVFSMTARFHGAATRLKAGEYALTRQMNGTDLLDALVDGHVVMRSFTIVEGWTVRDLLAALRSEETLQPLPEHVDADNLMAYLFGEPSHAEGRFLPETYHYSLDTKAEELLKRANHDLNEVLDEAWGRRDTGLPFDTPFEALALASIIEKETAAADERAMIAGVFVRRLQNRMRLETDPTVIYGLGADYQGNLTREHLTSDTEYNTYTRHGLPPTPIALPGAAAIEAAVNPAGGSALFFVATGDGDGRHQFSDNYEEHRKAVEGYLRKLRSRKGKP